MKFRCWACRATNEAGATRCRICFTILPSETPPAARPPAAQLARVEAVMSPGARSLATVVDTRPASAPAEDGWTEPPPPPSEFAFELPIAGTPDKKPSGFGIAAGLLSAAGVVILGLIGFALLKDGTKSEKPEVTALEEDAEAGGQKLRKAPQSIDEGVPFTDPEGRWSMEFDLEPRMESVPVPDGTTLVVWAGGQVGLSYTDVPIAPEEAGGLLDFMASQAMAQHGEVVSMTPATQAGIEARDVEVHLPEGDVMLVRMFVVGNRAYFIQVVGPEALHEEFTTATETFTLLG